MTLTFKEFLAEAEDDAPASAPVPANRGPILPVPDKLTAENVKRWEETIVLLKDRLFTIRRKRKYLNNPESFRRDDEFLEIAKKILAFAPEMDKILKKYYRLRLAHKLTLDPETVEEIKNVQAEWKAFIYGDKVNVSNLLRIVNTKHRGIGLFPSTRDIVNNTKEAVNFIADIREEMADLLKRAGRTDAQNAAADKASATMRARWNGIG